MKTMRWHPPGYGGERRDPDRVKRDGWRDQGVLAISIDDERLSWPERELVRQLGEKLYGPRQSRRTRRNPNRIPHWTPDSEPGSTRGQPANPLKFLVPSGPFRIREGTARNIASVRADFLGSHPGSRSPAGMPNGQ